MQLQAARASKRNRAKRKSVVAFKAAIQAGPAPISRGEFLRARNDFGFILRRLAFLNQHRERYITEIEYLESEHDKILGRVPNVCDGLRVFQTVASFMEI
jgi:hypothetical protein